MAILFIGIGSNLGKKRQNCEEAIQRLGKSGITILNISKLYLTKPVGGPPQEDFLNGVIKAETAFDPLKCLRLFKDIEKEMGRKPAPKDHPRVIDLDLLCYDGMIYGTKDLVLPHPSMHKREFVLRGFMEIDPGYIHPVTGKTVKELYSLL